MELELFVETGCITSDIALSIVEQVRKLVPEVNLKVIDVRTANDALPEAVFAVPTYLLDGRLISLGNPDVNDLLRTLKAGSAFHRDRRGG